MHVEVRLEIGRQAQVNAAVSATETPLARYLGTVSNRGIDVAVVGLNFHRIEPSVDSDAAVTCGRAQSPIKVPTLDATIAGQQAQVPFHSLDLDSPIAGMQVQVDWIGHSYVNFNHRRTEKSDVNR